MKYDDFERVLSEVEEFYGRDFPKVAKQKIFQNLITLTREEFELVCDRLMKTREHPPKLPNFLRIKQAVVSERSSEHAAEQVYKTPSCRCCADEGIVEAVKDCYTYHFRCDQCESGIRRSAKIPMWSKNYSDSYELRWKLPYSREYALEMAKNIRTLPGFLNEMLRRQRSEKKMTGRLSDFSFVFDEPWCNLEKRNVSNDEIADNLMNGGNGV